MANIYFSDFFAIEPQVLEEYGALNVSLINDLPVFIDPFLLFNSDEGEYQQLHEQVIRYMRFLKNLTQTQPLTHGLVSSWFTFPEVKQTWLGFSLTGNAGRGLGTHFANALYRGFGTVFSDFGNETVSQASHIEKLCLMGSGVGRDMISDFTTNLIKGYLAEYTQHFAREYLDENQIEECAVTRASFNYETRSWNTELFTLPMIGNDYVLLTPKNILTRDDAWINRPDLMKRLPDIAESIPDDALRTQLNHYLLERLTVPETLTERQERQIYADALL